MMLTNVFIFISLLFVAFALVASGSGVGLVIGVLVVFWLFYWMLTGVFE